jgi:hypothetical protein
VAIPGRQAASGPLARHDIRVDATGTLSTDQQGLWNVLHGAVVLAVLASWLAWLIMQVPSYRRSAGERRQQLKWLYSGVVVFVVSVAVASLASGSSHGIGLVISNLITPLGYAAFAARIGVAVLRYRLYAIDRIVSRVITYAIVTALTAGVFVGLVLLATEVLRSDEPRSWWRPPRWRWPWPRCSTRCGAGCSAGWTGGSTGLGTTPRRSSRPSLPGPGRPWISARCSATSPTRCAARSSPRTCRCGSPPGRPLRPAAETARRSVIMDRFSQRRSPR